MDAKEVLVTDVRKLVYRYLPLTSLKHIAFVSHADHELAWQIFYQTLLADSPLCEYLPTIQQSDPLGPYFEKILPPGCSFQNLQPFFTQMYSITAKDLTSFISGTLEFLTHYGREKLQPQICLETILADIDFVVEKLQGNPILGFLTNTQYSLSDRQLVVNKYRYIETCLTTSVLFIFAHEHGWTVSVESAALLATHRHLMQWLSSSNFIQLDALNEKKLLTYLINFVLGKNKASLSKEQVEELLFRLTDEDLCNYLPSEGTGPRRNLLLEVIKAKHPLARQIGVKTLNRMIDENGDEPLLLFLLNHFDAEKLSLALAMISKPDRWITILGYEAFMAQLLKNLTLKQLQTLIQGFTQKKFICLINSKAFLNLLDQLDNNSSENTTVEWLLVKKTQEPLDLKIPGEKRSTVLQSLSSLYKFPFLDKKAPIYSHLTDIDKRMLGEETPSSHSFSDTSYRRLHPMYFSSMIPVKRPSDLNAWDPKKDGPQVEEIFEELAPQPAEKPNDSSPMLTDASTHAIEEEKNIPIPDQDSSDDSDYRPGEIIFLPGRYDSAHDQLDMHSMVPRSSTSTPHRQSSFLRKGDGVNWKQWFLFGFLFLAGAGLFLSFLGLLEVSFALKACEAMINLLVECTPQAAALTLFIGSALIGLVTIVSAQFDHGINQNECHVEAINSDDTCSWNGVCKDSEKNTQISTSVFAVNTAAPINVSPRQTAKVASAENSEDIFCC